MIDSLSEFGSFGHHPWHVRIHSQVPGAFWVQFAYLHFPALPGTSRRFPALFDKMINLPGSAKKLYYYIRKLYMHACWHFQGLFGKMINLPGSIKIN